MQESVSHGRKPTKDERLRVHEVVEDVRAELLGIVADNTLKVIRVKITYEDTLERERDFYNEVL